MPLHQLKSEEPIIAFGNEKNIWAKKEPLKAALVFNSVTS